ncbi:MAG: cytochrome c-type biogenesis protein [Pseudomonadota bacterium]|nr:cytochrome c-type biogenesis protein [Pseudomonadota bacterium]
MRRLSILLAAPLLALMLTAAEPVAAPDRPLSDPAQEARAQALFKDVRCVVCQHEAIADSPAGVAGDMRRLIREQIAAGASDQAVRQDLVRRFGDYVLFTPPVRVGTWLLWFGPFILVLLAGAALALRARRRPVEVAPLSPEEERRLDEVLANETLRRDLDATSPHDGRLSGSTIER